MYHRKGKNENETNAPKVDESFLWTILDDLSKKSARILNSKLLKVSSTNVHAFLGVDPDL